MWAYFYFMPARSPMLPVVTALSSEQTKATEKVMASALRLLDYPAAYPDNALVFYAVTSFCSIRYNVIKSLRSSIQGRGDFLLRQSGSIWRRKWCHPCSHYHRYCHWFCCWVWVWCHVYKRIKWPPVARHIGGSRVPSVTILILYDNKTAVKIANNSC